jgi:hypothetical protein
MRLPRSQAHRCAGDVVGRMAILAAMLCALTGFATVPGDSRILFARGATVPPEVREFAWRVIEARCSYQQYEREQRSFLAYETRSTRTDAGTVYSIRIVSDVPWKKTEPPAFISMSIADNGHLRLAALRSSFIPCEPLPD